MSLLSCDFLGLYSTGIKGLALNGFDICSDTKLGTFILGAPLNWLYRSFVFEEVGSVPTLLHCMLVWIVVAHFDLPGFWDRCICRVELKWFLKPYTQFYFCGHCGLKSFDILQPQCWKTHLDCLTCCTDIKYYLMTRVLKSRTQDHYCLATHYWWNS